MKQFWIITLILGVSSISFSQEKELDLQLKELQSQKPETPVFKSYPNPVNDHMFVIGTYKIKSIEISDVSGKAVALYQFDKSIIKLDVSQLIRGIYLFKVTDENDRQAIKKLVVE